MSILQRIYSHEDLQNLTQQERLLLCDEIRRFLVESISKTGGHLASNLGMVELSVAIETIYDTNVDRLVFDVGHQSFPLCVNLAELQAFQSHRRVKRMPLFPDMRPVLSPLLWAWLVQELFVMKNIILLRLLAMVLQPAAWPMRG